MPKKRKTRRQQILKGIRHNTPLKPKDLPTGMYDGMRQALGRRPVAGDLEDVNFAAVQEVMRRGVELRLAQWLHTVMVVLRDNFDFTEEDLAKFSRLFRDGMKALKEYEAQQVQQEGEHDETEETQAPPTG